MNLMKAGLLGLLVFACGATASAGVLVNFPGAILSGSTPYVGLDLNNQPTGLAGYIDYAVFAAGGFPTGGGQFSGYSPTTGEYVYTYQITETGDPLVPLSGFSVSLPSLSAADNIGTFTGLGVSGVSPSLSYFFPTPSANWDFQPGIPSGTSVGLVFSSPFEPTLLDGSTIDHGSVAVVDPLPSPAPEPGTVIIWTCGIALAVLRGLKHRRA